MYTNNNDGENVTVMITTVITFINATQLIHSVPFTSVMFHVYFRAKTKTLFVGVPRAHLSIFNSRCINAVSYTHLTLPTKRIV